MTNDVSNGRKSSSAAGPDRSRFWPAGSTHPRATSLDAHNADGAAVIHAARAAPAEDAVRLFSSDPDVLAAAPSMSVTKVEDAAVHRLNLSPREAHYWKAPGRLAATLARLSATR